MRLAGRQAWAVSEVNRATTVAARDDAGGERRARAMPRQWSSSSKGSGMGGQKRSGRRGRAMEESKGGREDAMGECRSTDKRRQKVAEVSSLLPSRLRAAGAAGAAVGTSRRQVPSLLGRRAAGLPSTLPPSSLSGGDCCPSSSSDCNRRRLRSCAVVACPLLFPSYSTVMHRPLGMRARPPNDRPQSHAPDWLVPQLGRPPSVSPPTPQMLDGIARPLPGLCPPVIEDSGYTFFFVTAIRTRARM
jgi:hypothetical protein